MFVENRIHLFNSSTGHYFWRLNTYFAESPQSLNIIWAMLTALSSGKLQEEKENNVSGEGLMQPIVPLWIDHVSFLFPNAFFPMLLQVLLGIPDISLFY